MSAVITKPRPMPSRVAAVIAAAAVLALAFPVFLTAGWPLEGWTLAVVLWAASQLFGLLLARLRMGMDNLASSGVVGFGMMFRAIAVMVVVIAVAVSDAEAALAAALLYALAYTLELGVSVAAYFGGPTS